MRSWAIKQLPRGNPTGKMKGRQNINCKSLSHEDKLNKTAATRRSDNTDTVMVAHLGALPEVTMSDSATTPTKTSAIRAEVAAWVSAGLRANS